MSYLKAFLTRKYIVNVYIPMLLVSITFFWKFVYIDSRDICLDEPFTIFHAQMDIVSIFKVLTEGNNPPLFEWILHFWMKLFGTSPKVIRLLPLLFNSLTPIFLYLTGKKLMNIWSGIIAAGMFIFSTYHFYFGLETRTYSLLAFATSTALFFFISLINEPQRRIYFWSLIAANILMIYSHYFGWFVVFVQAILCLFYIKEKGFIKKMAMVIGTTAILFIPMAVIFVKQFLKSKQGTWVWPPGKAEFLNQLMQFLNTKDILILVGVLLFTGFIIAILRKPNRSEIKLLLVVFLWWFIPYSLMFLVSSKIPMFLNRYILYNTIGLYVFIGITIGWAFGKNKILLPVLSAFVLIIMYVKIEINSRYFYYREVKKTVEHVRELFDSNSIVIIHPHWTSLGFMYYFDRSVFEDVQNYETRLSNSHIYPVWNLDFAKEAIQNNPNCRIIYYQDGSTFTDGNNTIFKYLDSVYTRVDSVFYPQCFNVSAFSENTSISSNPQVK